MLLAVDKQLGITSYDVIRKLKSQYPKKTKIGHAGTLDPLASWLMLIGVFKWTKRLTSLTWLDKTYITTIDFSKMSDTRDMQYRKEFEEYPVETAPELSSPTPGITINNTFCPAPTIKQIQDLLDSIIPAAILPLTPFSAKKKEGKKLYEYAREWNPIFLDVEMELKKYKIISYNFPELVIELSVWKGTYIRSIWYRLGRELWLGWILTSLRRTVVWDYDIKDMKFETKNEIKQFILEE